MAIYEVIRTSGATGFQRCGHRHRSREQAKKCADRLNKSAKVKWQYVRSS